MEHWNSVLERMVDNSHHEPMDLVCHRVVVLEESVIVVVEEFDSMDQLVVGQTSFDYLDKTE